MAHPTGFWADGWRRPPDAASRCWKPHFRRLSNDLISEIAISESPCREIRQNGEQAVRCCKTNDCQDCRPATSFDSSEWIAAAHSVGLPLTAGLEWMHQGSANRRVDGRILVPVRYLHSEPLASCRTEAHYRVCSGLLSADDQPSNSEEFRSMICLAADDPVAPYCGCLPCCIL